MTGNALITIRWTFLDKFLLQIYPFLIEPLTKVDI